MLRNGTAAPDFTLPDDQERLRTLGELRRDRPLLLLFFRGAFCPTARKDLMAYQNVHSRIRSVGADVAAISTTPPEEHRGLRHALGIAFPLLSDADFAVSDRYGVYRSDETHEGPQPHGEPALFVLDVDGNVAFSQVQTGPKAFANPAEIALLFLYMSKHGGRY